MLNLVKYLFFITILSIAICNDVQGYRLHGNSNQDYYMDLESVFEMHFGPWDFLMNFSGRQTHDFIVSNEKTKEIKKILSWSKVIATTRVDEDVSPNHDAQKQNGTSYTVSYDPISGEQISLIANDDASQEMMDVVEKSL